MTSFHYRKWSLILVLPYLAYCVWLYTGSLAATDLPENKLSTEAREGRMLWAKYNCQSCHQLFKLGGYLGPELTHLMSEPGKNEAYAMAFMLVGSANMPALGLTELEAKAIARYLRELDQSAQSLQNKYGRYGAPQ